jgi:PEP-CTERM motif
MRKLVVACLVLGLAVIPGVAGAAPIGLNSCALGGTGYECDIFVDDVTGVSTLDATALAPGWLVGYTFLLSVGANLSDGIQETDVAHALVFHSSLIDLITPIAGSSAFSNAVASALALAPIDGTALVNGQIVGFPIVGGTSQLNGVGLFNSAETIQMLSQIGWGTGPNDIGGYDSLTVHTGVALTEPPTTTVPEPGTLSLLALAGVASILRRHARRTT